MRTELAPVYTEAAEPMQLSALSADETMQHLHEAADTLGGEVQTAMGFLDAYELYDITSSANKMPGSYTTYLESYEMPYIYISPEGTLADLLTAAHEYGHFVDGYVNCNQTFSIDCSEVFSQALEYLTLGSTSLGFARAAELRQYKLYDSLETFLTQACYYAFECKAYALPDSELTVGKLNELFAECCVDFGLFDEASAEQAARSWIDVHHFFSAPYYVISYCVSNDAALQIYQLEQETPGAGLKAFSDLLYAAPESTFLAMLQDGNLTSPFDENRMQELAAYFKEAL